MARSFHLAALGLAVALLAGCAADPPSSAWVGPTPQATRPAAEGGAVSPVPSPSPLSPVARAIATFRGTWAGEVYQYNTDSRWRAVLTFAPADRASQVATADYPDQDCSGNLVFISAGERDLLVSEFITRNPNGACNKEDELYLRLEPDGRMTYQYVERDGAAIKVLGEGILTKTG